MCGIFGVASSNVEFVNHKRAKVALNSLIHRGPDQAGEMATNSVFLGHRRLSIMDTSERGRQPFSSADGKVSVTVNGEIYNYKDLQKEIGKEHFLSDSDCEVILHGYQMWGIDELLQKIDGMFSIAIYDHCSDEIIIARDRVGIKPLYYSHIGGSLVWSSELKPIEVYYDGSFELEVDNTALYDMLTYLYIPTPKTLYRNVFKLEPATYLKYNINSLEVIKQKYWALSPSNIKKSVEQAKVEVVDLLDASVMSHLMSDVDVGFFLSGGLDSSSIVALASKNIKVKTFSIGFNDKHHDESYFANLVAENFKTDHFSKILDRQDATNLFSFMKNLYVEPFADSSALPTYEVSLLARKHSKVVLTGDGGDELFGGYRWYKAFNYWKGKQGWFFGSKILNKLGWHRTNFGQTLPGKLGRVGRLIDLWTHTDPLELYSLLLGGLPWRSRKKYRKILNIDDNYDDQWYFRKFYDPGLGDYKSLQYLDFCTYLHDDILTKVDRASMAVGLEARVPFLNTKLIEYCFSLPESVIYDNGELKGLLKGSFEGVLPSIIINRGKRGFSIPLKKWNSEAMGDCKTFQEYMLRGFL